MNRATKMIVSVLGVIVGIAGFEHGLFETMQGNTPTEGLLIQAIGKSQQAWLYGGEEAFTIVPNFLWTGILAMLVSVAIMVWSVRYIDSKYGATVFLLLCVLLFLFGGGIAAQVVFVPFIFGVATRINKPLTWWRKTLSEGTQRVLANVWPVALAVGVVSFFIGLYIAIFGTFPGITTSDPERILAICWGFIFGGALGSFLISFIAGFAYDIQQRVEGAF